MPRVPTPKKIRDAVLAEYDHRCAICAGDHPHIHHIDENNSNNDSDNLLPLCPNCHLRDQHNPTRKMEISRLKLFRNFKDPSILKPQFQPIYKRLSFLESIDIHSPQTDKLYMQANELIGFIQALNMGAFYGGRINFLIGSGYAFYPRLSDGSIDPKYEAPQLELEQNYRKQFITNRDAVIELIIEQLRYQNWP